jgi:hypothetical protein
MRDLTREQKKLYTRKELKAWKKISQAKNLLLDVIEENPAVCETTHIRSIIGLLKDVEWMFEDQILVTEAKKKNKTDFK